MHHLHASRRLPILLVTLALLAAVPPVRGQATGAADDTAANQAVADQLVLLMTHTLSGRSAPRPDQLTRAEALLELALKLAPQDANLWLLRAELAQRVEDRAGELRALQRYLKLEPGDDAAQLRLIKAHLAEHQTLDERLQRVEMILKSGAGRRLSAPLRSRLASYAAKAATELGDAERHTGWLKQAVALDPTNAEAAELTYQFAADQQAGVVPVGAAAVNVVAAAPADPAARVRLAALLLGQSAYAQAAGQFNTAQALTTSPLPLDAYGGWATALIGAGDEASAQSLLERLESPPQLSDAGAQSESADATRPVLPLALEVLRLLTLDEPGQADAAARSFGRIAQATRDDAPADDAAAQQAATLQRAAIAAVFGQQLDQVSQWLAGMPEDDPSYQRARGWLALQQGDAEAARRWLTPIAEEDPTAALGLATLIENESERAAELQRVMHQAPADVAGLLAAKRLRAMGRMVEPTRAARVVMGYMDNYPGHLWQPALTVSPWVAMQVRAAPGRYGYLEPIPVTLTLRNASQLPMALAPGQAAPTQVLLSASPSVQGRVVGPVGPMVVNARRKLTLQPGERLTVKARLDRSELGVFLASAPTQVFSMDVTAILGPTATRGGGVVAAPVGGMDWLRALEVRGVPATAEQIDQQLTTARTGASIEQMRALAWLMRVIDQLPSDLDTAETRRRIADAVNSLYPELDPAKQAWVVRFVGDSERHRQLFRRVFELAERSDEPVVRITYLATHVDEPASPLMNAALRHTTPQIRRFAEALKQGLVAQAQEEADAEQDATPQ